MKTLLVFLYNLYTMNFSEEIMRYFLNLKNIFIYKFMYELYVDIYEN